MQTGFELFRSHFKVGKCTSSTLYFYLQHQILLLFLCLGSMCGKIPLSPVLSAIAKQAFI